VFSRQSINIRPETVSIQTSSITSLALPSSLLAFYQCVEDNVREVAHSSVVAPEFPPL